jgi:hypothetical protein
LSQTGGGLKLQLDLTVRLQMDRAAIERELLRAVLLEMMYRNQSNLAPGTAYVEPPEWLIEGALALAPGCNRTPFIEALAASNRIVSLEDFLRQHSGFSELDFPAQQLYRAYSLALVQILSGGADGPARLGRYIGNLWQASNDPLKDLRAEFSELAGSDAEKVWKSNITSLREQTDEMLTFAETERRLDDLLSNKSLDLQDLAQRKISTSETAELKQMSLALVLLSTRANPVSRFTVDEYQRITELLAAGKRKGVAARLARLQATRARISARMSEVDDYLNWFEATKLETHSGMFADYIDPEEQTRARAPRRHDALSVYLDAVEKQF